MFSDELFNFRNRLLSSAHFRSIAQKLPFTQWVARRRANQLFRLASGFIHSQVLLACVRLKILQGLHDGPQSVTSIIATAGLAPDRGRHLLRAAAALQLLERRPNDSYGIGILGAAMLNNDSLFALVEHHALLYEDLQDPVALFTGALEETRMSTLWPYASSNTPDDLTAESVSAYTELMARSQAMVAEQVLDAYSLRRHKKLLDIGGGAGVFVAAAARRWPALALAIADLPAVAGIAREQLKHKGLADRIDVIPCDVTRDSLQDRYDVISLVRIIHDHDDARAQQILGAAAGALSDRGTLLIAEPLANARGAGALVDAYFNVYLLAMGSGQPRTFREVRRLLERAGFRHIRRRATHVPLITGLIVAKR